VFTCTPAEQRLCADSLLSLRYPDDKSSGSPSLFEKSLQNSLFYLLSMAMTAGDLIYYYSFEFLQFRPGKATLEAPLLNILDDVPTDTQMAGHILNGHTPGQFQSITFKGFSVASTGVGKPYVDLSDQSANQAVNSLNGKQNPNRLQPYRYRSETTPNLPPTDHSPGTASGSSHFFRVLAYVEKHRSIFILGADILISSDTESVI